MKTFIITIAILLGAALSSTDITPNDQSDYYRYWDCDGTTNPVVGKSRFTFSAIPRVGSTTRMSLFMTTTEDLFVSQLTLSVKLMGVQIYKFTEDVNVDFKSGVENSHTMWVPTEQAPGAMQITGDLCFFNEFGEKKVCWSYWMKILGKQAILSLN